MPWTTEQKIFIDEAYVRQKSNHAAVLDFLDNVWFSDEAHFLLSGHVNSKNIFWGSTHPEHCLQMPLHSVKCTAWWSVCDPVVFAHFQCGIDLRTSGRMDCDVIDVDSAPDESAKENSYFHVHGSHLQVSLAWSVPSPCFGRLCSHVAVALAWLLHWVAISKHGIIGPFWFEERSVTINTERYVQVLGKFWTALGRRRGVVRVLQRFQRDGATPLPQTNHWHGYSSVSLTDWSAAGVTRSGRRIHRTWTPQIFICGDTLRTGCMATTPRLSLTWRQ